jgi:hypothetical protein
VARRLLERRLVVVPERRRVRHPLRAAAERLAELERRLVERRFGAALRPVRRLPELRRRVAAAFLAALERLFALRRRVAAPFFAAERRLAEDVRPFPPRRLDAPRLEDADRLFALRRRVRHAFFAAADRFALVVRTVRFAVRRFGARCVFFLVVLLRAIFVVLRDLEDFLEVRFLPFEGGLTKTSSPSAIVPAECGRWYRGHATTVLQSCSNLLYGGSKCIASGGGRFQTTEPTAP